MPGGGEAGYPSTCQYRCAAPTCPQPRFRGSGRSSPCACERSGWDIRSVGHDGGTCLIEGSARGWGSGAKILL